MWPTQDRRDDSRAPGRAGRFVLVAACLALLYTAGTFLAPVLMHGGSPWGGLLHLSYAPVCHQLPERCLPVAGGFQAVCARCAGLYLGAVAGLFAGAFFLVGRRAAPRPVWLVLVAVPTLIDALLPWVGLPALPNLPRLLLAWPVGFVAALFVARGIEEIVEGRPRKTSATGRTRKDRDANRIARRAGRESLEVVDG